MSKGRPTVGQTIQAKYSTWPQQTAKVLRYSDCLTSRTALRPFKTLVTVEYPNGQTADMDLSFLRCNWKW